MQPHLLFEVGIKLISMPSRLANSRSQSITEFLSDSLEHTRDRANDAFELRHLDGQLFAACCSQLVVTSAAVASRCAPLRGHPSLDEHPLQRGVQRAFFDLQNVIRYPLNGIGDLISMHLPGARQRSQNQQIERSRRSFVPMQSITSAIVRLCHCQTVSNASARKLLPPAVPEAAEITGREKHFASRREQGNGVRVLVVEDEQTVARLIVDVLEDEGMHVDALMDGHEALDRAARRILEDDVPAVILLEEAAIAPEADGPWGIVPRLDAVVTSLAVYAPVVVIGKAERRVELSALIDAGAADYVTRDGGCLPSAPRLDPQPLAAGASCGGHRARAV